MDLPIQRSRSYHFGKWADILSSIPQGSIFGRLSFNIYINDIFYFVDEKCFANYADDNTPYAINNNIDTVLNAFKNHTSSFITWCNDNNFKMNADKCKLLITNRDEYVSISIEGETISASKYVKLPGLKIDNKLDNNEYVTSICKKATCISM